jgi:Flp pilus assembly protein TadD
MQYQSFKTKEEGLKQYQHAYEAAIAGKDVQGMIFNMLRMVDLRGEQPFDASSLELRNNIATLLYMAGEKTLATQSITEFADYLCQSENPHNRYVGQNFVIIYAMRVGQPEIALGYAQKTLKDKPDDVYALTIMMQIAKQELDFEKARELAQKICDLEPVEEGPCYQMAKKILSSEDEASGKH